MILTTRRSVEGIAVREANQSLMRGGDHAMGLCSSVGYNDRLGAAAEANDLQIVKASGEFVWQQENRSILFKTMYASEADSHSRTMK